MTNTMKTDNAARTLDGNHEGKLCGYEFTSADGLVRFELDGYGIRGTAPCRVSVDGQQVSLAWM